MTKNYQRCALSRTLLAAFAISLATLFTGPAHPPAQAGPAPSFENHKWIISKIGDLERKHLGFITFINGQLEGQSTCNSFSAVYKRGDDKSLTIFAIGVTQLICGVGDKMKVEKAFLADLEAAKRYEISGDTLIIYKDDDVEIARLK